MRSGLLVLAFAVSAFAEDAPEVVYVRPEEISREADMLRDAVRDPGTSDVRLHAQAAGLFDRVPGLAFAPSRLPGTEREPVPGKAGDLDDLLRAADARVEEFRKRFPDVPPPENLISAMQKGRGMKDGGLMSWAGMAENTMGVFEYMNDRLDGVIRLNERLKELTLLIGPVFAYATMLHEATHARDRAEGKLAPDSEIAGEISAFKAQYQWLMLMDPIGERVRVLHSTLNLKLAKRPDPMTALAVKYLAHLIAVRETAGHERSLEKLVHALGYGEKHASRPSPSA